MAALNVHMKHLTASSPTKRWATRRTEFPEQWLGSPRSPHVESPAPWGPHMPPAREISQNWGRSFILAREGTLVGTQKLLSSHENRDSPCSPQRGFLWNPHHPLLRIMEFAGGISSGFSQRVCILTPLVELSPRAAQALFPVAPYRLLLPKDEWSQHGHQVVRMEEENQKEQTGEEVP